MCSDSWIPLKKLTNNIRIIHPSHDKTSATSIKLPKGEEDYSSGYSSTEYNVR